MSIVLAMLHSNTPLCKWKTFDPDRTPSSPLRKDNSRKIAQRILNQCGHADVIELVAKEFDSFPDFLRIDFRTLASDNEAASGNVRKGLQRLNERMGGKLLRQENTQVFNKRVETQDDVSYRQVKVNEAVAGAKRKYGKL